MIKYNLFIAFTKAQLIHIQNILTGENFSHIVIVSRFDVPPSLQERAEFIYTLSGGLLTIRASWLDLNKALDSMPLVNLYIAHSFNLFTQGIQHKLLQSNKLNSLNIIPDGNLLFNNYSISRFDKSHLVKKIAGLFISSMYKSFEGNIISPFATINTVYSYLPEVTCKHERLKLIDMPKVNTENNRKGLLILGHRNQKVIPSKELIDIIIKNINSKHVYYKPHPRLKVTDDLFYKEIQAHFANEVKLIIDDTPIEVLIEDYPVEDIFAVASSSLITLKILMPNVRVNYFGLEKYLGKHYDPLIKEQFNYLGLIEWN